MNAIKQLKYTMEKEDIILNYQTKITDKTYNCTLTHQKIAGYKPEKITKIRYMYLI